jgi:hypothetical protein
MVTHIKKAIALIAIIAGLQHVPALAAGQPASGVYINGIEMTMQQIRMLEMGFGFTLPPGQYLAQNACILHLESEQVRCAQLPEIPGFPGGEAGPEYGNQVFGPDTEGYFAGGGVTNYGYNPGDYINDGYGYGAGVYGGGSNVYSDGTYGYSYGTDGYSYQGGVDGGYGYNNSDGSWFHRNGDYSGGYSVGSDSNGCIYTPNWSNC